MRKKKTSATLVVLLAVFMVLLYLFGFLLSQFVFRGDPMYADAPIPALPYIFLFDSAYHDRLAAELMQAESGGAETSLPETEAETEPGEAETVENQAETEDISHVTYVKGKVTEDYFADALFIGDSRTDGLYLYSPFEGADYFSGKGMTVFGLFDKVGRDGETRLPDLLAEKDYEKIYLMLGINEIGTNLDLLVGQFASVIEKLREAEPDAIIVLQGSLSVDEKTSSSTWYLTAERIRELNGRLSELADGETVFYIDANELFCDEKGYLKEDFSGDGVHLYTKYYTDWTAWLMENGIIPEA